MDHQPKETPAPRRRAWVWIRRLLLLAIIYTGYQLHSIHYFGRGDTGAKADCAIVLGAAAYHDKPSPVLKARVDHGIKLYREGRVRRLILTGGYSSGAEFAESEAARKYALSQGIPEVDLLIEKTSLTTSGNVVQAKRLMDENALHTAIIVSDPWHLKRGHTMATDVGIEAIPSATTTTVFQSKGSRWNFLVSEFLHLHYYYIFGA